MSHTISIVKSFVSNRKITHTHTHTQRRKTIQTQHTHKHTQTYNKKDSKNKSQKYSNKYLFQSQTNSKRNKDSKKSLQNMCSVQKTEKEQRIQRTLIVHAYKHKYTQK